MPKKKIIIIVVTLAAFLAVLGAALYFVNKERQDKSSGLSNPAPLSVKKVFDGSLARPQSVSQGIYFTSGNKLKMFNYASAAAKEVLSVDKPIFNFSLSPLETKAFIQTSDDKGEGSSYYFSFGANKPVKLEDCVNSYAWDGDSAAYYNCARQSYEYDPNTVNSLVRLGLDESRKDKIYDFKIDPPKKLIYGGGKLFVLTGSPGYKSNDILALDLKSFKTSNLTDDGFVLDAKMSADGKYIMYGRSEKFDGLGQETRLLNVESGKITDVAAVDLDATTFGGAGDKAFFVKEEEKAAYLSVFDLSGGKTTAKYKLSDENAECGQATDLIWGGDSKFYLNANSGLCRIEQTF